MSRNDQNSGVLFGRIAFVILGSLLTASGTASAVTNNVIGGAVYTNWPLSWIALNPLNDPDDNLQADRDIVGDTNNPAGYWARDDQYIYFRMRIDDGAMVSNPANSYLVMMNVVSPEPIPTNNPFAFSWDSKSNDNSKHGLEMSVRDTVGATWGTTKFNDIDGINGQKIAPPDIRASGGDGYLRTITDIPTTNFGSTAYIDYAVSWTYLYANTPLTTNQTWLLQFGVVADATDHNVIGADVAANKTPSDPLAWAEIPTLVDLTEFAVIEVKIQMIRWTTACEINTAGFNVYRQQADGNWLKVNSNLIPALSVETGVGGTYSLPDVSAESGVPYVYKLEEIETDGTIIEYGPFTGVSERSQPLALSQPVKAGENGLVLRWQSRTGERYTVKRANALTEIFMPVATGIMATPPENVWQDPDDFDAAYYQIQIEPY